MKGFIISHDATKCTDQENGSTFSSLPGPAPAPALFPPTTVVSGIAGSQEVLSFCTFLRINVNDIL